jgi:hypothetical protein
MADEEPFYSPTRRPPAPRQPLRGEPLWEVRKDHVTWALAGLFSYAVGFPRGIASPAGRYGDGQRADIGDPRDRAGSAGTFAA